jgi:WD40 repeat protein
MSEDVTLPPTTGPDAAMLPDDAHSSPPGYEILGTLGRGGMGVVYLARQSSLNRVVALKMVLSGAHAGDEELARFRTEAEAIARLQHPNIVQVHEVGELAGRPYFSLEFCGGGSLEKRLDGTPWQPREATALVRTLAQAMQAAHARGVVHRDLKPANVLLADDGTPKITDFGLAKKLDDDSGATRTGAIMGTPSYMAPEQAQGKKDVGPLADVYALGAILYELLTGRPPFRAATALDTILQVVGQEPVPPCTLNPAVPRDLETVALKCLAKEPARRYATAAELADDLGRFLDGEPVKARPPALLERGWRWMRKYPAGAAALALLTVVLTAAVVVPIVVASREAEYARRLEDEKRAALRQAAESTLARGIQLCENRLLVPGLHWMVRSLELARQAEAEDIEEATRWNLGLWRREVHVLEAILTGPSPALSLDNAPGGGLITGHADGRVWLYEGAERRPLMQWCHPKGVENVKCRPGKPHQVATLCLDGRLRLIDTRANKPLWERPVLSTGGESGLAFSPDGDLVIAAEKGGRAYLLRADDGSVARVLRHSEDGAPGATGCAFSPDGTWVVVTTSNWMAKVFEAGTGKLVHGIKTPTVALSVSWSRDEATFATGHNTESSVQNWDAKAGRAVGPRLHVADFAYALAHGPDWLACATRSGEVRVFEADTWRPAGQVLQVATVPMGLAASPDGKRLAAVCSDGTIWAWRLAPTGLVWRRIHPAYVLSLAFSPDGRELVVGMHGDQGPARESCQLHRWDVATGQRLHPSFDGNVPLHGLPRTNLMVGALAFGPGGRQLHVATHRHVNTWDARKATIVPGLAHRLEGSANLGAARSPGRTHLGLRAVTPPRAYLWDMRSPERAPALLAITPGPGRGLAFHPRRDELWVGTNEKTVQRFDVATGRALGPAIETGSAVSALAFHAEGGLVALGDKSGKAWQVGTDTHEPIGGTFQHPAQITNLEYAASGQLLLASDVGGLVRRWHAPTGLPAGPPLSHGGRVEALEVSPDCRLFACGSYSDKSARMWLVGSPVEGDAEALRRWVERLTLSKMDDQGTVTPLGAEERRRLLRDVPSPLAGK